MKAQYKGDSIEADLTIGKKYDVIDVECRSGFEASKIYIENDKKKECWYSVKDFIMYAEAAAGMQNAAAVAGQSAALPATPDNKGITAFRGLAIGEAAAAGIQEGMKEPSTEIAKMIQEKMCALMYGA